MEIKGNCPNCKKPNLIDRPWRNDIFCGWCGTEYMKLDGELVIILTKNDHLTLRNRKQYDRDYQKNKKIRA